MPNYLINFDTYSFFTKDYRKKRKIKFNFLENELFLSPSFSNKTLHKILIRLDEDSSKGYVILRQFLSSLSWKYDAPVIVRYHGSFGGRIRIRLMKENSIKNVFGEWDINHLFEPTKKIQRITLSLYHQGMNNSYEQYNPYAFLDFYKIIALIISKKTTKEAPSNVVKNFINDRLSKSNDLKEIVKELLSDHPSYGVRANRKTVGEEVRRFRNKLAHAITGKGYIDFDSFLYWRELNILRDLLLEIAKDLMKNNLSIDHRR